MYLLNGAQYLNTTFLVVVFTATPAATVFGSVIDPLTSMYGLL